MSSKITVACVAAGLLATASAHAATVFQDEKSGTAVNLGVLIQPTVQLTAPTRAGSGSKGIGAPDGKSPSVDFYSRRTRILVWGKASPSLSYYLATDLPNLGKGGDLSSSMFVQDALLTYRFAPAFEVDAGLMVLPFARHTIEGSVGLHLLDYHLELLRLATGKAFRDVGVEVRGLLWHDLVHYRIGAFEGIRASAAPAPPAGQPAPARLNSGGVPRFVGHLRVNLLGSEPDFSWKGVYFSAKPLLSIGIGADFQPNAVYKADQRPGANCATTADVFLEYPLRANDEVILKLAVFQYTAGSTAPAGGSPIPGSTALATGGNSVFLEAGYRHGAVEPVAAIGYLVAGDHALSILTEHVGLNWWIAKHAFNIKSDFAYRRTDILAGGQPPSRTRDLLVTIQTQVFF